jgi:alkanesulfonate monooxygenase SsuD/methylene tetrahydromethanopterin reductase-like flavin-dependent oxidoreductase (luciferase family)
LPFRTIQHRLKEKPTVKTGVQVFFQAIPGMTDYEMLQQELDIALRAEELGFDYLLSPEHHFVDYSIAPDPIQLLSYVAARTSRIGLVTGAVILPWNDPMRVAEKASLLDFLSGGRLVLGFGRGLARVEYEKFGIDMGEARGRFDEAAPMILDALRTGSMSSPGPFYPHDKTPIRPVPGRSFEGRIVSVAKSDESARAAADIGAGLMFIVQKPIEEHMPMVEIYRDRYREVHGTDAPMPWLIDFSYVHEDPAEAERVAQEYMQRYYLSVLNHYEYGGSHLATTKGYESYAAGAALVQKLGLEESARRFVAINNYGSPEQVVERVRQRRAVIGDYVALFGVSFGGLEYEKVYDSCTLLGEKVLPAIAAMRD